MKITKYPQSCLMIETKNKKILVDPGSLKYKDSYFSEWMSANAILITHRHPDHINLNVLGNYNIPIYSTNEVKNTYSNLEIKTIRENDIFNIDEIKIEVVKAIHGYNPNLKDGKEVFENVGYIIDDGNIRLYITSDTICFNNDYNADVIALPITGYGLTMSSYEASLLSKEVGAKLVLPVHMDNDMYPTNIEYMKENFDKFDINYKVLDIEECIEI